MILDAFLTFTGGTTGIGNSDGATDSPTTGAQASSNVVDLGVTSGLPSSTNGGGARDIGVGDKPAMKLMVDITTTFLGGTDLTVAIQGAPDNGSGSPGSYTTMAAMPAVVVEANLLAGRRLLQIDMPRPVAGQVMPRFLRMLFTSTGTHTSGKVEASLVVDRDDQITGTTGAISGYPAGINIAN